MTSSPPPPEPTPRRPGPARRYAPLALTVVFVLFAAGVIIINAVQSSEPDPAHCVPGTPITVAASTEKDDLLAQMATEYGAQGGCARVTVSPVNSGDAARAFTDGRWDPARGPRPDVWSPAASAWIGLARTQPGVSSVVPDSGPSLARSPLVFALPETRARALGWPDAQLGWSDLARLGATGSGFTLGKTNPTVSTSGLFALLSTFAAGKAGVLDSGALDDPDAVGLEQTIENDVVHYGNTEQEFLDNFATAAGRPGGASSYVSAVAVEEKSVFDYNRGNPRGRASAPRTSPPERLVTFTPKDGTLVSDSPYLTLTWPNTSQATKDAAADFYRWLADAHQQQEFAQNGFRTGAGPDAPLAPTNAAAPGGPVILPTPAGAVVGRALSLWTDRLRKPANITLTVDLSGSMACGENSTSDVNGNCAGPVGVREQTRLTRVKDAAGRALAKLRAGDTLSVRTFRSDPPSTPWRVAVPPTVLGPPGSPTDGPSVLAGAFASERPPGGGTALYRTTRDAIADLRTGADTSRINAVILLTDGEESVDPGALDPTVNAVASDPAHPTRLFAIAYSRDAGTERGAFASLQQIALSSGGYAYDATDPTDPQKNIDKVFDDLIANF